METRKQGNKETIYSGTLQIVTILALIIIEHVNTYFYIATVRKLKGTDSSKLLTQVY